MLLSDQNECCNRCDFSVTGSLASFLPLIIYFTPGVEGDPQQDVSGQSSKPKITNVKREEHFGGLKPLDKTSATRGEFS